MAVMMLMYGVFHKSVYWVIRGALFVVFTTALYLRGKSQENRRTASFVIVISAILILLSSFAAYPA